MPPFPLSNVLRRRSQHSSVQGFAFQSGDDTELGVEIVGQSDVKLRHVLPPFDNRNSRIDKIPFNRVSFKLQ